VLEVVEALVGVDPVTGVVTVPEVVNEAPGIPETVEAAETVLPLPALVELPLTSCSTIEKDPLVANTLLMSDTFTNSRVNPDPGCKRGRGIPTEPRDVSILFATPMLGLN